MFQAILAYLHAWVNYGLALYTMAKNREIGCVTVDRKVCLHLNGSRGMSDDEQRPERTNASNNH